MRGVLVLLAVVGALAVPAAGAVAADCPKTSLAAVEAEVMCPVCGTPLGLATEAPQANRERALIQRLVDRCRSKEEIKAVLVAQFGDDVLALPEAEGFDLTVYLVPALALLAAGGGILVAARRWRRRGATPYAPLGGDDTGGSSVREPRRPTPPADDAGAAKRLDADLERYEL